MSNEKNVNLVAPIYMDPDDWKANTEVYSWAVDPYQDLSYRWSFLNEEQVVALAAAKSRYSYIMSATDIFNECGALAKWMVDKGWRIDTVATLNQPDGKFQDIQKGDILFFAEQMGISGAFKMYVADMFRGYNYRNITHAAIVTDVLVTYPEQEERESPAVYNPYRYKVMIIDVPSILENYLKQNSSHFEYRTQMEDILPDKYKYTSGNNLSYYMRSWQTLVLVCRPDLRSHKKSHLEIEAETLGLHTIPETEDQLEIIKKCRACSDIEWTPAIDYDRPMPLTGGGSTVSYNLDGSEVTEEYYQPIIQGKFKAGVKYKGLPWTAEKLPTSMFHINMNPEAFLSLVEHETSNFYQDENDNKYPLYGWNDPWEFLQFVFGNDSIEPFFGFSKECFYGDLEDAGNSWLFQQAVPNSLSTLQIKLGDILYSHVPNSSDSSILFTNFFTNLGIITDIIKNDLGEVVQIELTEATRFGLNNPKDKNGPYGNLIRRKWFTLLELSQWFHLPINMQPVNMQPIASGEEYV